ncbi:MAG TPA: HEAT repeat domain-containing protein [Anaerolineales bacterium]|nr:HEAT repeat domain-containing protein [Anaerolineales bacterium]
MSREKVVSFLKVRPEEIRLVVLMALLFLSIQAGQGIGENAAFALFLSRLDVSFLPYMYMGLGVVVFIASITYSASLSRFQNAGVVTFVLAGTVMLFLGEWFAIVFLNLPLYSLLWLTTYGMSVILGTLVWMVAGEVCDARQAKRLFPLFTSMGILGSVVGNALTGVVAKLAGTENLVLLYASLLTVAFFLTQTIARGYFKPRLVSPRARLSLLEDIRSGYEFVRGSNLFKLVAITSVLYSVLFFAIDFPFSESLSLQFSGDEAGLAGFKGAFTGITTAVTFLVSLLLANRLYTRLGIINSILIMPVTYIVGFLVFYIIFSIQGAVFARFSQLVVLGGLVGTAWNALFNVVPLERRGQVLAFNNGVPAQIGVIVSGLLIVFGKRFLDTKVVLLLGVFFAGLTIYLTFKMRSAYGQALLDALRAGRAEVFNEEEEAFAGFKNDPAAVQVLLGALNDPRALTRRMAVEMLVKMEVVPAIPDLVQHITDPDAGVRSASIRALSQLGSKRVLTEVIKGLDDPDDSVRIQTLTALAKLEVDPSPETVRSLERLLKDANVEVRAHAAFVLLCLGENKPAISLLMKLLRSADAEHRRVALDSFGHILDHISEKGNPTFKPGLVLGAMNDLSPVVRRTAIQTAAQMKGMDVIQSLAARLSDEDAGVRKLASESLKQAWPEPRSVLVPLLVGMEPDRIDPVLDSIPPGDPEMREPLRKYIQGEVTGIRNLRTMLTSFPEKQGSALRLLEQTLRNRESISEERLIKAVGLFGNPRAMSLVRKSMHGGDAGARAAALEALETLGDKEITKEVLPILDRGGMFQGEETLIKDIREVILRLLEDDDYWLRALAARSVPDLGLKDFIPYLRKMRSDPVPFVRSAARDALVLMDGEVKMKTLKTLSTLERILLLREVPMFSKLSPEDLEKIAGIAQEQLYVNRSLLCREGEPGSTLFIIVSGSVDVIITSEKKENIIASRGPGEFVGEMAILNSMPRSATLRASGEVRALVIDGESFNAILLDRPEVSVSVLRYMSGRVRQLSEKIGGVTAG